MAISEKTIGEQLSSIPFREKHNAIEYDRVLRGIKDGEVKAITLEKTFVPANEIGRYVIVDHIVRNPSSSFNSHTHIELCSHVMFDDAQRHFREMTKNIQHNLIGVSLTELLLVGKFGEGGLSYNKDGELDKTSGITLDFALTLPGRSYSVTTSRDPYSPVTIQEKLYVMLDAKTETIQLYDGAINKVTLNDFWKQKEGPSINGVKIQPKNIEDIDLLPKNVVSQGNGIKR
jgi:hypothetical protein